MMNGKHTLVIVGTALGTGAAIWALTKPINFCKDKSKLNKTKEQIETITEDAENIKVEIADSK